MSETFNVEWPRLYAVGSVFISLVIFSTVVAWISYRIRDWLQGLTWLFKGPQILQDGYEYGKPFTVRTPERRYLMVSSEEHVRELSSKPEKELSLVAIAEEVFQPHHTMNGVEMTGLDMHRRLLRKLTGRLNTHHESMKLIVEGALDIDVPRALSPGDSAKMKSFDVATSLIARVNALMFCGQTLSEDEEFVREALQYSHDVVLAAECVRCLPKAFAGTIAWIVTRGHKSSHAVRRKLKTVIESRILATEQNDCNVPNDYLQGIIDTIPIDDPDRINRAMSHLLALWFASIHQPSITLVFALHDLAAHPEHVEPLRKEIEECRERLNTGDLSSLKLLDHFMKESARVHTSETISIRRKAMSDFTFSDGTTVAKGEWACVPQHAIMNDSHLYRDAHIFDPSRYEAGSNGHPHAEVRCRWTDVHPTFPFWGLGRQSCPGRFYAAYVIKLAMINIIEGYNIERPADTTPRLVSWRSMRIPLPSNYLVLSKR